jgi:hypothetical protein
VSKYLRIPTRGEARELLKAPSEVRGILVALLLVEGGLLTVTLLVGSTEVKDADESVGFVVLLVAAAVAAGPLMRVSLLDSMSKHSNSEYKPVIKRIAGVFPTR